MSDDLRTIEEKFLVLDPAQRARLLRVFVEVLDGILAARQGQIAETRMPYTPAADWQFIQSIIRMSGDPHREGGEAMEQFDRITRQPGMMGGRACIRGMRVTVGMIVNQIGTGSSFEDVLVDYPYLEREDILQALRYAAWRAEEREIMLTSA